MLVMEVYSVVYVIFYDAKGIYGLILFGIIDTL
jgi:hypothetical protein